MNNLANSSAEPAYLAQLALNATPFGTRADNDLFFNGAQIEQRLNLLFHLVHSSEKVGLLLADKGAGKSTLLAKIQQDAGDDLRIIYLESSSISSPQILIQHCLQGFGVEENTIQDVEYEPLLKIRFERLQELNIRPLILVDDVETFSSEMLAILLEWLSWQTDGESYLLHAIFTTNQTALDLDNIHGRQQRVDLPALTEDELSIYLMQRLEFVGFKGELPFSQKELKKLYRQSSGNPAQINQLAHQQLLGIKPKTSTIRLVSPFKWIGIGLIGLILILLLVFQDKINAVFIQEESLKISERMVVAEDDLLTTVVIDEINQENIEQVEQVEQIEDVIPVEPELSGREELTTLVAELPVIVEAVETPEVTVTDISPIPETITTTKTHQQDWIRSQSATNYTFQLMGSWNHDTVLEFIEQYELSGDMAEFESERNGKTWYALIYGVYDNKQAALEESSRWSAPLNTLPSWLRRFDSVQKQLKNTAKD